MEKYTLISFISSIAFMYMGVYAIRLEPNAKLNRIFLALSAIWAWWALTYSYVFMAERVETVWFWYRLSSIGWCNFPGFTLHFALIATSMEDRFRKVWLYPALYIPGALATAAVFSSVPLVAEDFVRIDGIWFEISNRGVLSYIFPVFYSAYALAAAAVPFVWFRPGTGTREKKLGIVFIVSIIVTLVPGALTNNIFPLMGIRTLPAIGYVFGLFWIAAMTFVIVRYKFMGISAALAADAIMERIKDIIILTDPDGRILRINRETQLLLGRQESELKGGHVSTLADNPARMAEIFASMKKASRPTADQEVTFRMKTGDTIPLNINGSAVKDPTGSVLGVVIAGFDLRPQKSLESLNDALRASNRELEESRRVAERDMKMAVNVQSDLFPAVAPETDDWETAFLFRPASGISGDMYDFYMDGSKLLGASLFDVSGHGISSGLISILARSVIARNFYRHTSTRLADAVGRINDDLVEDIGGLDHYLSGILLRFRDDVVEYVNAGHPDLIYRKASTRRAMAVKQKDVESKSFFLGVKGIDVEFDCLRFKVFPGDVILMFSDALIETPGEGGKPYTIDPIVDVLQGAPEGPASAIIEHVMASIMPPGRQARLSDDLTIIALRKK